MWTEEQYRACLEFFLERSETDPVAKRLVWLLIHVGVVPMYADLNSYNRVIEVVLTQKITFTRSGKIKRALSELLGTREYSPEQFLEKSNQNHQELLDIGIEEYVLKICEKVSEYTIEALKGEERELTVVEIEGMKDAIHGFSDWSVNVSCINCTFSPRYEEAPYNALTPCDPVVKRGLYWLTGIEPYRAVLDQLTELYSPHAGVITRYLWQAFNPGGIKVKLPPNYKKWGNKGKILPVPLPNIDSEHDRLRRRRKAHK